MEDERKSALRDTLEKYNDSEQESEESKVGLILRKGGVAVVAALGERVQRSSQTDD